MLCSLVRAFLAWNPVDRPETDGIIARVGLAKDRSPASW
jgi:hypothetical protein